MKGHFEAEGVKLAEPDRASFSVLIPSRGLPNGIFAHLPAQSAFSCLGFASHECLRNRDGSTSIERIGHRVKSKPPAAEQAAAI